MSNHYNYTRDPDKGGYTFTSDSGVEYMCYFFEDETISALGIDVASKVLQFSFFPVKSDGITAINDYRLKDTIVLILEEFFAKYPSDMVLYLCDDSDGKGRARSKLFSIWFRQNNNKPQKRLYELRVNEIVDASIVLLNDHPEVSIIQDIYDSYDKQLPEEGKVVEGNVYYP